MSYREFKKRWYTGRPTKDGRQVPSPPTISRIWKYYKRKHDLRTYRGKTMIEWFSTQYGKRTLNPNSSRQELEKQATLLMAKEGIIKPPLSRFRRALRTSIRTFHRDENENRFARLEQSLGVSIKDLPVIRRWTAAQELIRYPPASIGKANLPKMAEEHKILRDITNTLVKNNLNPVEILANPNCDRLFQFVERRRPSLLSKWEQRKVLEALPFYLAARLRESIDAVLLCLIRKARLLRSRVNDEVEEDRRAESLAFMERSGRHFRELQAAIAEALAQGSPEPLMPFQKTLARLTKESTSTLDRNRLYRLIGSRGSYTRKIARRLVGIHFRGHEPHAKATIEALQEVFSFAPFEKKVQQNIVEKLDFLRVPSSLLSLRQVFEPIVIITLADYLWSGRVTVDLSRRYSFIWSQVPKAKKKIDAIEWIKHRRKQFEKAWSVFEKQAIRYDLVKDGRLRIQRLPRQKSDLEELYHRRRHEELVSDFNIISILELVFKVNRSTNYLDEFRLSRKAPHQLSNEERLRLVAGTLITQGMNIGIREMPTVLDSKYTVGRLQDFIDNYMTKENLVAALDSLLRRWIEREMGLFWGPGHLMSVDGRVVGAFKNNLLSRYHYRKGRSGMTRYWTVRDDGMPTGVRPLGNQDWESWYALDELLHPLASQDLRSSCGDTQGQFLTMWGLSELVDKEILARFRRPSRVLLFKPSARNRAKLKNLRTVQWEKIEHGLPCMLQLTEAVQAGKVKAVDILRRVHLYDDNGLNVMEAFHELGKVNRTEFLLRYASDEELQLRVRNACNDAELWNSFHEAIFWGNGGKLRSNDPHRQEESLLALTLLMASIVFHNVETYGKQLKKAKAPTPVIWDHIQVLGKYQFRRSWISGGFTTKK